MTPPRAALPGLRPRLNWPRLLLRQGLGLPALLVVLAFAAAGASAVEYARIRADAAHPLARFGLILGRETRELVTPSGGVETGYFLDIEYRGDSAQRLRAWAQVSARDYADAAAGGWRPVAVSPDDRREIRVVAHPGNRNTLRGALALCAGFLAASAALGWHGWRGLPGALRAWRRGEARMARVSVHRIQRRRKLRQRDPEPMPHYRFDWQDVTGTTGVTNRVNPSRLPEVGAQVTVLIDPVTGRGWWDGEY